MVIGENAEEDARRFYRSEEGIVLVTRDMLREIKGTNRSANAGLTCMF